MHPRTSFHLFVAGATERERALVFASAAGRPVEVISAHRHHRGPYTFGGELLRHIWPELLAARPQVADADLLVHAVAPDLLDGLPAHATLTMTAPASERTRYYPAARTLRLAHGVTDLVLAWLDATGGTGHAVAVDHVDEADQTDQELLAVLVRRVGPDRLRFLVGASTDAVQPPLASALVQWGARLDPPAAHVVPGQDPRESGDDLVRRFVWSDCTSDEPALRRAYERADPEPRAALHDERADTLAALLAHDRRPWTLGALPLHRERGSDPSGAGADALQAATDHCTRAGYYEAAIELGQRALAHRDWEGDERSCWFVVHDLSVAAVCLGRPDDARRYYDLAGASTANPIIHCESAYGRAMLYIRHYPAEQRDFEQARLWANTALALAALIPERKRRDFLLTFNENGLALLEKRLADAEASFELVTQGLHRLDDEFGPSAYALHRSVLIHNRAQLLVTMGRLDEALGEYDRVIACDPCWPDYYFERADLRRALGDADGALADYATTIALGPPLPEAHYNRADLAYECGHVEDAVVDLERAVELAPELVDAHVNRTAALAELGRWDEAVVAAELGLAQEPDNPSLHYLAGAAAHEQGRRADAVAHLEQACQRADTPELRAEAEELLAALAILDKPEREPASA